MSWQYTDASNVYAQQINDDGSVSSCLVSSLPNGTVIAAASTAENYATVAQIQSLLSESDKTMTRVAEAVALGFASWTNADVVAFVEWRRALRAGTIGTKPAYPQGT